MFTVAFSALASLGVAARSWCCTREPSCARTSSGTSVGLCVTKKTPDALGPDQPHGLGDRLQEVLRRVGEQQVRLVEEEHQARLLGVAELGQVVEQVGEQPHQEGGEDRRPVLQVGQLDQRDDALAVRRACAAGRGCRTPARRRTRRRPGPRRRSARAGSPRRSPTRGRRASFRSPLPSSEVRNDTTARRSARSSSGSPAGVGVVEHQAQRRLLGVVEPEHLRQQRRAERRHRGAQRDAGALAAEGEVLHGEAGRGPLLADRRRPRGDLRVLLARAWRARTGRP